MSSHTAARSRTGPVLALTFNALVWGCSWLPFRTLQDHGLHPLWATVLVYLVAVAVIAAWRPAAFGQVARTPALWVLVIASGTTNAAFNWAVSIGDVVRVVLLFYLMPLWAVLLARLLLDERLRPAAALRVAVALTGAVIVLWPPGGGLPLPRSLPDWLGVVGGFSFALNNVMLRREARRPEAARALAMFLGGVLVAGTLAATLALDGRAPWPPQPAAAWLWVAAALALAFLASNMALQYGAAHLPANSASVVMISEVLFASVSAVALGAAALTGPVMAGGALIIAAAVMAALERDAPH